MSKNPVADSWRREVIYQIFIDRFAGYDPGRDPMRRDFLGGDIAGVTANLQYIKDLGASCVYMTPFLRGPGYHGYHVTDFFGVEQNFGNLADLKAMVAQAHILGLRVMMDFVPNHCHVTHPFFVDAQTNPNSAYRDWFTFTHWPDQYLRFLHVDELPKINLENPKAREHVIRAAEFWVKELGIDAMRLDHVIGPSTEFWREFRARMRAVKPDLFLLAEASLYGVDRQRHAATLNLPLSWERLEQCGSLQEQHSALIGAYRDTFDGYIDFAFHGVARDFASGKISQQQAKASLTRHYARLSSKLVFATQLDNHDLDRIMFVAGNDVQRVKDAISLQFSYNQPHIVYYGTELGMSQTRSLGGDKYPYDLPARQPMPGLAERQLNHQLQRHYRDVAATRRGLGTGLQL